MGLPSANYETDREQIAAISTNQAPELSPSPTAFIGELAGAQAQITQSIGGDVDQAGRDAVPSSESSEQGLTNWSIAIGLSNGTGGYGPRGATFAQGYAAQLTGRAGTSYLAGQQATTAGVTLRLRNPVTLPGLSGTSQAPGVWDADPSTPGSAGTLGNLTAGTVLELVSPPATSDSTITLGSGPSVAGQNAEQPAALLLRIQFKMQRPPNGGNGTDYKDWGENATDSAGNPVVMVELFGYVYPNYYGDGSPLLVLLAAGSGTGRLLSPSDLAVIALNINGAVTVEGKRPVGTDCTVLTGYMPDARQLTYIIRTVPSKTAYAFDWARGSKAYSVVSKQTTALPSWATSVGANALLTIVSPTSPTTAPISLKDAITANASPRIQVDSRSSLTGLPSGPVIPEQWPCLAFQDALGQTSLALRVPNVANFDAWVQPDDLVYAGGPIVGPVGAAVLANTDQPGTGPSRISGLADRAQLWNDTIGVTTLSTAAENTLDADGVTRLVARCIAGGVRIGIGAATPSVQDVTASDNTINGPEVLRAGRIIVSD